jgi:DNA-binding NarL/FixJ family response regulator
MSAEISSARPTAHRLPELSVGVAAHDEIHRRRVASVLEQGGLNVTVQALGPDDLISRCKTRPPDAIVLVWDELGSEEIAWLGQVHARLPRAQIVAVATSATGRSAREALEKGVDGVVMEAQLEDCLAVAVRSVCSGQLSLPPQLREAFAKPALSAREKQALAMVVLGFSNGEIAKKLHLAESTVKNHLSSAFTKLGVRSRNEAAALILDAETGLGTGVLSISDQ